MTDDISPDVEFDAIAAQLTEAGHVKVDVEADGTEAERSTPEGKKVALVAIPQLALSVWYAGTHALTPSHAAGPSGS